MYTIKVSYITGDSFGNEETSACVGTFSSIEEAQEACAVILDHEKFFKQLESWRYPQEKRKRDMKAAQKKSWYVPGYNHKEPSEFSIKFKDQQFHASWRGYFETLLSLEIVLDNENKVNPMMFYPD